MTRPLLLLLFLAAAGCDRPRETASTQGRRKLVLAAPPTSTDTSLRPAPVAAPSPSVDTVHWEASPAMMSEACHEFAAILVASAKANGKPAAEVGAPRDTAMAFGEAYHGIVEPGCRVAWRNDEAQRVPLNDVTERAMAAGWTERDKLLLADGPDGSVLAVSRGNIACVISGSWDGGDDSDSTYVPSPGFEIAASCFVNRPDRY
jgi:hypothetical protein